LRRLQTDALEIATVRLPARVAAAAAGGTETAAGSVVVEPIGVQSTDEIGRVARAFDQVHAEAVRLAGTEAQLRGSLNAMFISLSRRSVPLIERLARMIDSMEQNEDDSNQLAKLFNMDHLVTRMRRNSENLLVLAGEEPVRKWTESVPLADVTRAAASEIEQYGRVALAVQPGIMISGQAAADVVHLLAELIENATLFSPQSTQVRVTVMELSTGGVLVEVRDDGVGVSPSRLSDMNWRLDHPPVIDVSISRHMGLYAVSRLAARHGIRVKLRPAAPQGLSALVWLPGTLAKREAAPAPGSYTRAFGVNAAAPVTGIRSVAGRPLTGRHRSGLATSGDQPLLAGQAGGQAGRPTTAWFAAKRPSSGAAMPAEELATGWQPATNGIATAGGTAAAEPAERTASGLPRRVPRTSAHPAQDTPGSGMAAAGDTGVPVLGAPHGENASPGASYQEAPHQGHPASRRRSPDAARSRLSGFQLGRRDAVQAGHGTGWTPFAEEENSR
jgi:signal transduction histidine kinase